MHLKMSTNLEEKAIWSFLTQGKNFYAIINSYNFLAHITNVVHAKNKY